MARPSDWWLAVPALCLVAAGACDGEGDDVDAMHVDVVAECDNVNPDYCMMPWPSSRYLVPDADTATGWRVDYVPEAFPPNIDHAPFDVSAYNRLDGFPASSQIITLFDAPVDGSVLPPWWDYDASLADDSPTVLLNMDTGERVAHFAEFDVRFDDPAAIALYIRPARRLDDDTRYAVAIRGLSYDDGGPVQASPVFAALRDGQITDSPQVEGRRPGFEEVFEALEGAGVPRGELIQAWDFHTASGEMAWGDLVAMRDDAMERLGDGLGIQVTNVVDEYDDDIYRVVEGTFTVPLYLDDPDPPSRLVRGADGRPAYQGEAEYPWLAMIPRSVVGQGAETGRLLVYGHGFFGTREEIDAGWLGEFANEYGFVLVATDWIGMATGDVGYAAGALANVSEFTTICERLLQGMLNVALLSPTMRGIGADLPEFTIDGHRVFDPSASYYMGVSQGGIFGATVMAISPDMERGALNVGASLYALMQGRSINFDEFELIYSAWYENRVDREFYWSVMTHLWDFTDPITYLPHLLEDPLPGSTAKKVLLQVGLNDAQVSNVASDLSARTAGFVELRPTNHEVWGLEAAPATPYDGSAIQYWDCGDPPIPEGNEAPEDNSAHQCVRRQATAQQQIDAFLRADGQVQNVCDGACDPG